MKHLARCLVLAVLCTAYLSCTGDSNLVESKGGGLLDMSGEAAPHLEIARSLALALGSSSSLRAHVRDAMRDSPFTEHKVVLQEFLMTGPGQDLLFQSSSLAGTSVRGLQDLVDQLPPMDFYVPLDEQRVTWRGGRDLYVAVTLNVDDRVVTGFDEAGRMVQLDKRDGVPQAVVLLLHPAEHKSLHDQLPSKDDVIEPRRGGLVGAQQCEVDCGGSGGGQVTTILDRFWVYLEDGWGDLEIEFRGEYLENGSVIDIKKLRYDSIDPLDASLHNVRDIMFYQLMNSASEQIRVELWETDCCLTGADDYFGTITADQFDYDHHRTFFSGAFANGEIWLTPE